MRRSCAADAGLLVRYWLPARASRPACLGRRLGTSPSCRFGRPCPSSRPGAYALKYINSRVHCPFVQGDYLGPRASVPSGRPPPALTQCIRSHERTLGGPIIEYMDGMENLVQIREAARLAGCHADTLRRAERAGDISSRRAPNGYRLFDPRDLAKLLSGGAKRARRVPLDRVHRQSFIQNNLAARAVDLVFLRPPTADARAGVHPDRYAAFLQPYLTEARRILTPKGSLILCAKESARRSRDLYLADVLKVATDEVGFRLIDEFCWVRSRVAPARIGPGKLPDGWLRCIHLSPSSSPDTYPEQVESRNGNGKPLTLSRSNVLVMPPERGVDRDEDTPVELVRHFVTYCTREGGIVCDPLAVPATPLAAMSERRRYICYQSSKARYHAIMAAVAGEEEKAEKEPPVNDINDLSPGEWMQHGASVWSVAKNAEERRLTTEGEHPAVMPVELCKRLIRCLLPSTDTGPVLDPFCGVGSTLLAAGKLGKRGIGFDINESYVQAARDRVAREGLPSDACEVHCADAAETANRVKPASVSMVLTSPPFWNILDKKRTVDERPARTYDGPAGCLSRVKTYSAFVTKLADRFRAVEHAMRPASPCVIEVMDLARGSDFFPFHIDLCAAIRKRTSLTLVDTIVWNRADEYHNHRPIGWGQRWLWRHVHSYLLVFRRPT